MPHSKDTPLTQEPRIYSPSEDELAHLVRSGRIVAKYPKQSPERRGILSLSEARALISPELFRGPEEVERVFGFQPVDIPPINFTREELERAKERGECLVLRSSKDGEGKPLTPARMQEILEPKWASDTQGVLRTEEGWRSAIGTELVDKEVVRDGWALISPDLLPNSTSKNYFDQTELLITELKAEVYKGSPMPSQYGVAITEYESQKADLLALSADNTKWQEASKRLSELKITQLLRPSATEDLYDLFMKFGITKVCPRSDKYNWTSSLSRGGYLVYVGLFVASGVHGDRWRPLNANGRVGASFSRLASPKL